MRAAFIHNKQTHLISAYVIAKFTFFIEVNDYELLRHVSLSRVWVGTTEEAIG